MPVLFEEKRIFFSSAEKEAPEIAVVARNCSIVYCFDGRPGGAARTGAAKTRARPARPKRWEGTMIAPCYGSDSILSIAEDVTLLDHTRDGRMPGIRRDPPEGVAGGHR